MLRNLITATLICCFAVMAWSYEVPYRELRGLWDMTDFPFESLAQTEQPWLLLQVTAGADSGATSGLYIDAATGKLVRDPGKTVQVTVTGMVRQAARFDGQAPATASELYSWGVPVSSRARDQRPLLYSPFKSGGTILSQFWGQAGSESAFKPYYVVPETWPAGTFSSFQAERQAAGSRWMKVENTAERQRLTQQLAGGNPIIALQAFRALLSSGRLSDEARDFRSPSAGQLVRMSELKNRGLVMIDALRHAPAIPTAQGELGKLAAEATSLEELQPLATAARAVLDFGSGPEAGESKRVSRDLLNQCAEAINKLPGGEKAKEQLQKLVL